jgi:hypothetical protein
MIKIIISPPVRIVSLGLLRQILLLFHMRINIAPIVVNWPNSSRIPFRLSVSDELPVCRRQRVRYHLLSVSLGEGSLA